MASMGVVGSMRFTYAGSKWRAVVTYLVEDDGADYKPHWRSDSSQSRLENEMNSELSGVQDVVTYDFSYGKNLNAAIAISSNR